MRTGIVGFTLALWAGSLLGADIVIFRGAEKEFAAIADSVQHDLKKYMFADLVLDSDSTYEKFRESVLKEKPKSLILLDNKAIEFGKRLRLDANPYLANLKGVAGMGLNLKRELQSDSRFCGIAHEVPGYTLVTSFRRIYGHALQNVLVLYRSSKFEREISDARNQLVKEGIKIVAVNVEAHGDDGILSAIDHNLKQEVNGEKIDAIWVLADNAILNQKSFSRYWIARAGELKVPFICTIHQFAQPKLNFCTYAASPRPEALASQIVEMTLAVIEDGADPQELGVDYLLGTDRVINMKKVDDLKVRINLELDPDVAVLK